VNGIFLGLLAHRLQLLLLPLFNLAALLLLLVFLDGRLSLLADLVLSI
jgi:hypothetical protein